MSPKSKPPRSPRQSREQRRNLNGRTQQVASSVACVNRVGEPAHRASTPSSSSATTKRCRRGRSAAHRGHSSVAWAGHGITGGPARGSVRASHGHCSRSHELARGSVFRTDQEQTRRWFVLGHRKGASSRGSPRRTASIRRGGSRRACALRRRGTASGRCVGAGNLEEADEPVPSPAGRKQP